jgi:hypothetical protein
VSRFQAVDNALYRDVASVREAASNAKTLARTPGERALADALCQSINIIARLQRLAEEAR